MTGWDEVISKTREDLDLTVRAFAPLVGGSRSLVSAWERRVTKPRYTDFYYLAQHTDNPRIRQMALGVMEALDPARYEQDTNNGYIVINVSDGQRES